MFFQLAQVDFNTFLAKNYVDIGGVAIALIVGLGLLAGFTRWKGALIELVGVGERRLSSSATTRAAVGSFVVNVLYQKPLADCSRTRWAMHFAMFWGFLGLALSTTLDAIMNPTASALPILHPVRIVGNIGGLLFISGLTLSMARYAVSPSVRRNSSLGDFFFVGLLMLVASTGFLTEFFSDTSTVSLDSFTFWSHLVLVGLLLVTAPFTKFAHAVGRPTLLLVKRLAKEKSSSTED